MLSSVNKETGELSQVAGKQATADKIFYDNSETGIPASNVQEAIDKSTRIFYGTRAEWNQLTTEEKVVYEYTAFPEGSIKLYTDKSDKAELDREVFADITLTRFPAREFHSMINDMTNIIGCYEKLNSRNKKKDEDHLNKHAMHLIRLYLMCLDILEREEICTYRKDDREMLLEIRRGKYQQEDGTYSPEFFEMVNEYEKRLKYAKEHTSLPKTPDYKKVEEFVMDVNRKAIDM